MVGFNEELSSKSFDIINGLTKGEFKKAWDGIIDIAKKALSPNEELELHYEDREQLHNLIHDCIYGKGGDVSARNRTVKLGTIYLDLSSEVRQLFHDILARDFDINKQELSGKIREIEQAQDEKEVFLAEVALKKALTPPRQILFKQFSSLPNGLKFLIDMRATLLAKAKDDMRIKKLSLDIKELLAAWFDIGLLDLQEITWNSPASLLEKLIAYEAVHEISSLDDLRNRLVSDRLCFAFFHNKMPSEPLIFVEVALVNTLSNNIQELLDKEHVRVDSSQANTAIFYSISNTQIGLAGISLGNFLIKAVVQKLSATFDQLKHFATLSPIPGFREWLEEKLANGKNDMLRTREVGVIKERNDCENADQKFHEILIGDWYSDKEVSEMVKPILSRLCVHYLLNERRGSNALDPVAHFHLSNGAMLEQVNWLADLSGKGKKQSYGLMVNYYYKLAAIDTNHEEYVTETRICASSGVKALLK